MQQTSTPPPFAYSFWPAANALTPPVVKKDKWPTLVEWLYQVPEYQQKNDCPLIKLATFGTKRKHKPDGSLGSYRNDDNVLHVYGIEIDYDGGIITPEEACTRLEQRRLRATIYTSYSHQPQAPRWRALLPLAHPILPAGRLAFAEAINGIFDGAIASESATLSQSYFIGRRPGSDYQVISTFDDPEDGNCIDEIDDWYVWRMPFPRAASAGASGEKRQKTSEESADDADGAMAVLLSGESVHNAALHLVGRWVAKGLGDAEIRQIMESLAGKVAEVRGADRARDLLGDELDRMIQGAREKGFTPAKADISALLDNLHVGIKSKTPSAPAKREEPQSVPDHLLSIPGKLNLGVQWLLANSKKPQPIYAVQAMLALGATVLGRRYRTDQDNWPSLFLPVLGLSATGKEAIKYGIEQVLTDAGLEKLIGPSKYTSDSGLVSSLIYQPSHICVSDEFGKILSAAAEPNNTGAKTMLRMMMEVWGRCDGVVRPIGYATAGLTKEATDTLNSRCVYKPAMTFVGLSTPDAFYEALTRGSLIDGFINRMLIVECHEMRKPSVFLKKTPPPTLLIDWCKSASPSGFVVNGEFHAIPDDATLEPTNIVTIPFSESSMARVCAFDAWCIEQSNELQSEGLAEMYGRTNEISMRLALIVAVSCESATIELEHLDWAIGYVAYWTREMIQQARARVSDGLMDAGMKDVERLLKKAGPDGLSLRELRKSSRRLASLPIRAQIDVLQMLKADHVIDIKEVKTKTKPKEVWFYIGDEL